MQSRETNPPSEGSAILLVGQDLRGRWLVQDIAGRIEGFFISRETAIGFARAECDIHDGTIEMASAMLTAHILH